MKLTIITAAHQTGGDLAATMVWTGKPIVDEASGNILRMVLFAKNNLVYRKTFAAFAQRGGFCNTAKES
jgi:hypothetical protein